MKTKQLLNNRSQVFQQEKLERIQQEKWTVKQKEEEMEKMEQWEMDLIKKLKNTHEVQKNIYEEYDSLMTESIENFEKKFKPPQNTKYLADLKKKNALKTNGKEKNKKFVVISKNLNEKIESPLKENLNEKIESPLKEENLNEKTESPVKEENLNASP